MNAPTEFVQMETGKRPGALYGMQPTYGAEAAPPEPPHSTEAEQGVLGGLMLDNSAWSAVEMLAGAHFFDHAHRLIYAAFGALMAERQPADVITVFEKLQSLGKADDCGGLPYLNALCASVPSAANVGWYGKIVIEQAALRDQIAAADEIRSAAFQPGVRSAVALAEAAQMRLARIALNAGPRAAPFKLVDLEQLGEVEPPAQAWFWDGYIPAGFCTMLSGHGGSLKTTFSLGLACSMAAGVSFLGVPTRRARVLFFSGEDPAELVLRRVARICRTLGLDPHRVRERLTIVDATEFDPVLYAERRAGGDRSGATTATYAALERLVEERQIEVLIVDNASDTFEGDEIKRSLVGAFMRSLVELVRPRCGAVLLLAHVDKGTSRAGKAQTNTEAYSGSTAWHNKARSRLFLLRKDDGRFELQHQKNNVGPLLDTIELEQIGGMLQLPVRDGEPGGATAQAAVDTNDTRALLRLIAEFNSRGEIVSASPNSPQNNAAKLFASEKTCPKRTPTEIFALLRDADRNGLAVRIAYSGTDRKKRERWGVTDAGRAFAGLPAATAATAATGSV